MGSVCSSLTGKGWKSQSTPGVRTVTPLPSSVIAFPVASLASWDKSSCKPLPWLRFPDRLGLGPLPAALGNRARCLLEARHKHSVICKILVNLSREALTERVLSSSKKKIENGITIWSSKSFSGHIPKKSEAIELKARTGEGVFYSCAHSS